MGVIGFTVTSLLLLESHCPLHIGFVGSSVLLFSDLLLDFPSLQIECLDVLLKFSDGPPKFVLQLVSSSLCLQTFNQ
jgi:hypothetical protein